ncbi:MAG: PD-(D/E)XK nuclease family protein, partial [Lachnospiraceae bacterium]|nr:PD-(D/E)XK nuclease family protein [Lachnospiraceae bacterium]
ETGEDRRAVLDDIGKSLLLRRVASRCADDLQILKRGIHSPGMIDEIKSVLSEFMQYGIGTDQIREMADYAQEHGQNALQLRLRDLIVLYEAFRKEKEDRYVTGEETLELLAKAVPQAKSLQGSVVVFDGFTGFTPVQYRVVMALIRCAREVVFSFTVSGDSGPDAALTAGGGPAGSEENLFYLSRKTVYDIIRMASKEGLPRGRDIVLPLPAPEASGCAAGAGGLLPRFAGSRVLGHLEQHLFRYPEVPFVEKKEGETERSLAMFTASTPQEEVRQIFAQVRRMIARTGCAYRDFAIVTADLETYGDLFALEAERSGIPVYIDRTSGAFHNILIEGIRSVLQIPVESFSYTSVFRYLRSGLSRLTGEEADMLENYCLANGISSRKKWSMPFDAACEEARIRFLREVEPVTGLEPGGREDDLRDGQADLTGGGSRPARRRARTAAVRTRELYDFLCACGAQARMDEMAEEFGVAGDVVRERQYRQIYRAVIDLLDQIYDLAGSERISARDYLELLEAGFSQIRLGTIPQRVDRILVGDIERTRLTQIRHLFFAGVNEGSIPRSASRGGILSDMDREFLADGPAVLAPTPRQQMFTQRLYLYLNMTKPSETLTISFAKTSQDGRSLRPSYLVSSLRGLFPELRVQVPEDLPARLQITSAGDGLHLLAGNLRRFVEGADLRDPSFREEFGLLYGFFTSREALADPQTRACVERLRRAALRFYRPELLRAGLARAVYGDRIVGGISRMETAARCYLMHHLRYGLRLRERDLYEFSRMDGGTVLHAALERFDTLLRREGLSWRSFSQEDAQRLSALALREEAAVYRNLLLYKSARDESRLDRYAKRLLRTVDTLAYQLRKGDFDPVAAELAFGGDGGGMPPIRFDLGAGRQLILVGRIDRVDLCKEAAEEDPAGPFSAAGRRYLRIMDYKSGFNDLDPGLIRRGLQLQLITYMRALMQAGPAALESLERAETAGEAGT